MKHSKKKFEYVKKHLISYKMNVQLSNKLSFFDNARFFENFASKILEIIFSKKFINLNEQKNNFPGLDIASADNEVYVQVSTQKNVRAKINKTINFISNSTFFTNKEQILNNFVVVSLNDLNNGKNGKYIIGGKTFELNKNLFTVNSIISRCATDYCFLNCLFNLCQYDSKNFDNWNKFQSALELSKRKLSVVDDKINNVYSIDRSDEINNLEKKGFKNLLIYGSAGVGKTAFAKSLLLKKQFYIFVRAEKLVKAKNLDDVLNFNIKELLENNNFDDDIYIFVDSIESISESNYEFDLLLDLFYTIQKYSNAHIILSCRTFDKINFIKLISNKNLLLDEIEIRELNNNQIALVRKEFYLVNQIFNNSKLPTAIKHLLRVPFYLNQIVMNVSSINEVNSLDKFQNLLWKNIICLNNVDCEKVVKKIVIEKARTLKVAVDSTRFNSKTINKLLSAGILIHPTNNENEITLKYDIFGDICGELIFDYEFNNCDGDYNSFMSSVSKIFGNSVHRRYQIWVEFKLFKSNKSDKFIFDTIFLNSIDKHWREQTIIGIIRSNFSDLFFQNYYDEIIDNKELFGQFINLTNLSGFSINKFNADAKIELIPIGRGRFNLIKIIQTNKELFDNEDYFNKFIYLVSDFLNSKDINAEEKIYAKQVAWQVITILSSGNYTQRRLDGLLLLLSRLYNSIETENDVEQITHFLNDQAKLYSGRKNDNYLSKKIIMFTLNSKFALLIKKCPEALLNIMNSFFMFDDEAKQNAIFGFRNIYSNNCNLLNFDYSNKFKFQIFEFLLLFSYVNFWKFLCWMVDELNALVEKVPNKREIFSIYELKVKNKLKKYYGNKEMWTWEQYNNLSLPPFIIFAIKNLCYSAKLIMSNFNSGSDGDLYNFFVKVKKEILLKSNNISLFILILYLSVNFKQSNIDCLELISNVDLCRHDNERILLKRIFSFNNEDKLFNDDRKETLLTYTLNLWNRSEVYYKKLCELFDLYLYKSIDNTPESSVKLWNIRKMDFRQYKMHRTDGTITFDIEPTKEMNIEIERIKKESKNIIPLDVDIIKNLVVDVKSNNFSLLKIFDILKKQYDLLMLHKDNPLIGQYVLKFIELLSLILNLKKLNKKERTSICNYWINIYDVVFRVNQACLFGWTPDILFNQLNIVSIDDEIATKIYNIMIVILTSIKNRNWNNAILSHWNSVKMFLSKNIRHSTIVASHFKNLITKPDINFYEALVFINIGLSINDEQYFNYLSKFINKFLDSIKLKENEIDYQLYYIVINELRLFVRNHIFDENSQEKCLSLFFNGYDFSESDKLIIDFYNEVFNVLTLQFFDNCCNHKTNLRIKKIFIKLENKIKKAPMKLKIKFYKILTLSITNEMQRYIPWYKFKPHFRYFDKQIINSQFNKFGVYNPEDVLQTIKAFGFINLSPEILIPIENIFIKNKKIINVWSNSNMKYLIEFMSQAYINQSSEIKSDRKLRNSFINILNELSERGSSIAWSILNEFLIH